MDTVSCTNKNWSKNIVDFKMRASFTILNHLPLVLSFRTVFFKHFYKLHERWSFLFATEQYAGAWRLQWDRYICNSDSKILWGSGICHCRCFQTLDILFFWLFFTNLFINNVFFDDCSGNDEKLAFCKDLGADVCINYKSEDFVARVREETGGKGYHNTSFLLVDGFNLCHMLIFRITIKNLPHILTTIRPAHGSSDILRAIRFGIQEISFTKISHLAGVDVILDCVGASYFQRNLDSLNLDGRLFIIGFQGGVVTQVNLQGMLARRLTVQGMI